MRRITIILILIVTTVITAVAQESVPESAAARSYRDSLMLKAQQLSRIDSIAAADRKALVKGEKITASDSTSVAADTVKVKKKRNWATWTPDTKKCFWYSLIPGGGQIYNRKYWKLPIIYGGLLGCVYAWRWNGQMYSDYRQAYDDITDNDPTTRSYEQFSHIEITDANKAMWVQRFKSRKDQYRRWRDLSIIAMCAVYALSLIDAYVDASLSKFDISDDLTLHVQPAYIDGRNKHLSASRNIFESGALGVNCRLDF